MTKSAGDDLETGMPMPEPPEIVWEPNRYPGEPANATKKPPSPKEPHWIVPKKKGQQNLFE
jgi:hypothetical protein